MALFKSPPLIRSFAAKCSNSCKKQKGLAEEKSDLIETDSKYFETEKLSNEELEMAKDRLKDEQKAVDDVINRFLKVGLISKTESEELLKIVYSIVTHPKLSSYYKTESEVFNEREILTQNEQIIIPDRLVLNNDNEAVIIDYKTGCLLYTSPSPRDRG